MERAIEIAGGLTSLARFFGESPQRVGQWRQMPVSKGRNFLLEFCREFGTDPVDIRPDLKGLFELHKTQERAA